MPVSAVLITDAAAGIGPAAGFIAVGGFLAHARPVLAGKDDRAIRSATVIGGLGGLAVAALMGLASLLVG